MVKNVSRRSAISLILSGLAAHALAQGAAGKWPERPVRLIVPAPAGGSADFAGRVVGNALSELWGQSVVVDNRPGGSGVIGTLAAVRSPADGYTLLLGWGYLIQRPSMSNNVPYDVHKDLIPISRLVDTEDALVVPASLNVKTVAEFINYARTNPTQASMAIYGQGTSSHLHAELFKKETGLPNIITVPFQGITPVMSALLGNQVKAGWTDLGGSRVYHKSSELRFLAKVGVSRSPLLPDVPTFTEVDIKGFEKSGFIGLFAPAGTPAEIVNKAASDVQKVFQRADVQQRFTETGSRVNVVPTQEFSNMLRRDEKHWAAIARDGNIRID
jgi:tripartite-type tricarboxylate transporter receptor subunit TctC